MKRELSLSAKEVEKIYHWTVHGGAEKASTTSRERYEAWLREKPARLHKARRVQDIWQHPDFENAVRLVGGNTTIDAAPAQVAGVNRKPWYAAAAAGFLVALSVAFMQPFDKGENPANRLYSTEGQQTSRTALADGSTLDLSARSKVAVNFTDSERHIRLYDGEAQFTVARDSRRPFVVESRQASIKALGTIFNVDQRDGITELTVLEGRVSVHPLKQPGWELEVGAGERLHISSSVTGPVQKFDPNSYKSWLQGVVQVEDVRLSELLIEFNRFSASPLVARDHKTRNLRVSGSFDLNRIEDNIRILATLHSLKVSDSGEEILLQAAEDP